MTMRIPRDYLKLNKDIGVGGDVVIRTYNQYLYARDRRRFLRENGLTK